MNPVESYLSDYYGDAKTAAPSQGIWNSLRGVFGKAQTHMGNVAKHTATHASEAVPGALVSSGIVSAVGAIGGAIDNIYAAATKERDFKSMLEFNPDLAAQHKADPKYINASFNTLRNINRGFSKDPMVAGAYVRQVVDSPLSAYGAAAEAMRAMPQPSPVLHATMQAAQQATRPDASMHYIRATEGIKQENEMGKIREQFNNQMKSKAEENRQRAIYDRWHNENVQTMRNEADPNVRGNYHTPQPSP